jgi:hypothetical protein
MEALFERHKRDAGYGDSHLKICWVCHTLERSQVWFFSSNNPSVPTSSSK